jgi:hypothetical protein
VVITDISIPIPRTGQIRRISTGVARQRLIVSFRHALIERSGFGVPCHQAAIIFSFVMGIASRKNLHRGFAEHQRP